MADKSIGELPNLADIPDDALLVMEYEGNAYNVTGAQFNEAYFSRNQPDWSQNDPAAKDYVKNRTHYKIVKMEPLSFNVGTILNSAYVNFGPLLGVEEYVFFKITDTVFTKDQLDGAKFRIRTSSFDGNGDVSYAEDVTQQMGGIAEVYGYGGLRDTTEIDIDYGTFLVVPNNVELPGVGMITKGTYFRSDYGYGISTISHAEWTFTNEVVFALDPAFLLVENKIHHCVFGEQSSTDTLAISVGDSLVGIVQFNGDVIKHIANYNPISLRLNIDDTVSPYFVLTFPIREPNNKGSYVFREQVVYSCELGVLLISFAVDDLGYLHITASKLQKLLAAETVEN